jgi:predicted aminopeptidase
VRRSAVWMATLGLAGTVLIATAAVCLTSGCSTLGYYAHSARGHLDLMGRAKPVTQWVADASTPAPLRERLQLTQRMRDFAVRELKLPDNKSYRAYADLGRPAAVWNVVATHELSLDLHQWCFVVVGCIGYRGYYERALADQEAQTLRAQGLETSVYGVPAYSTLGWTNWLGGDPLLSTFIRYPEGELARLIFHELAHQVAYAADDTVFNESFATAVERIGGARWLAEQADAQARAEYETFDTRRRDFRQLTFAARSELAAIYAGPGSDDAKRAAKAALFARLRADYETLKRERWGGYGGYDGWFAQANNASLAVQAAYNLLVPAFERLFEREGRDFTRFYAEVQRLARLPKAERHATLAAL